MLRALFAVVAAAASAAPAFAQTIIRPDPTTQYRFYKSPSDQLRPVAVTDPSVPFTQALHVKRAVTGINVYDAAVIWNTRAAVKKGDLLLASFWVRRTTAVTTPLKFEVTFQRNAAPFSPSLVTNAPVDGSQWRKFVIPFYSKGDYAPSEASLQLQFGLVADEFDIGGVAVENFGPLKSPFPSTLTTRFAYYYPGRGDPNAPWRLAALANINAQRKGAITIRIVDADGAAIPGAAVTARHRRTSFYWATAVQANRLTCGFTGAAPRACLPTVEGRSFTQQDQTNYRNAVRAYFTGVGFENDVKWPQWEADRQLALDGLSWLKANGVRWLRGHNVIWPGFKGMHLPPDITAASTAAYVRGRVDGHFDDILTALGGRAREWDVVNEPFTNYDIQGRIETPNVSAYAGVLPTTAIADWYIHARALDPKAKLFLNDFRVLELSNPTKARYDADLIRYIKQNGGKVDGFGFQAHFAQSSPDFAEIQKVVGQYAPVVSAMAVTEFDSALLDEALQADILADLMTFAFGNPKFTGFKMWGFWDADHWLTNSPVFASDWRLKPSGQRWINLTTKTWRTPLTTLTTNSAGSATLKGFFGDYRLTVAVGGKTCVYDRSIPRSQTITLKAC